MAQKTKKEIVSDLRMTTAGLNYSVHNKLKKNISRDNLVSALVFIQQAKDILNK